jgi:large subunit ribosomal protein L21e
MVQKSHGQRHKSRKKMQVRRVVTPSMHLQSFELGERVGIKIQPNIKNKGYPYIKFHGLTGKVVDKRGDAYVIQVRDKSALKTLILKPVHLKKLAEVKEVV